jgi:hypothetical protein
MVDKIIEPMPPTMPEPRKEETLEPGTELRINRIDDHLKVLLVEGKAEIFGRELPLKMPVYFHHGEKVAIFTFHGARI